MSAHPSQGEPFDTQFQRTLIEIKAKPPSVPWMLAVLSTMDSNHAIFAKSYVKPKPMRNGMRPNDVNDENDFFAGLPV